MIKIKKVTLELPITLGEDDIEFVKDMHEKWDGYAEGCPFKYFFEQTDMEKAMRMLINITTPINEML